MNRPATQRLSTARCRRLMIAALPMLALALALPLMAGCARCRSRTWAQFSPLIAPIEIAPLPDLNLGAASDARLEQDPNAPETPDAACCDQLPGEPVCATCGVDHHIEN